MKKWMKGWGRRVAVLAAAVFSFSLHAAPGGTLAVVDHPNTYPTPQNLKATLTDDGRNITLQWDGVRWPVDGYPEEVDGKDVPTNFYYEVFCRTRESGTTEWSAWWNSDNPGRFDWKTDAFLERVTMTRAAGAGTNYQFRVRCVQYVNPKDPHLLPESERIQDVYSSEYTDIVTAYRTLDKLELTLVANTNSYPLRGAASSVEVTYKYDSSRAAEGEEPLYFTFTALEIPYPAPGTVPEAPAAGSKPYARRGGTPLAVTNLYVCPPNIAELVDPSNFTLAASSDIEEGDSRLMTWYANSDLENYYHTNVTIWVQGWAQPETAGGKPRRVLDEAIGNVTIDTRCLTAGPNPEQDGVLLTWPSDARVVKYEIWRRPLDGGTAYLLDTVTGTSYTDTAVSAGVVYRYEVKAFDSTGTVIDSAYASGYSRLDAFSTRDQSLYFVQPQTPWNGKVDIVVRYHSARDARVDGTPHFKLIAENYESGASLSVKTLTRADGEEINPDDFTLEDEHGLEQRLVWDAGKDLGETLVERLRLTVDCAGVEPYWEGDPVTAWTGSAAKYKENIRLDTRNPRIRKLGQGTEAYVDLDWFPGATKADLYCNGTLIHTTTDAYTRYKTLNNDELNVWGTNELKVVTDTGVTWTGGIAYPAFGFTVSEGNEDGITLTWNTVDDTAVGGYQIRRRVKGSSDDFEAVATVGADVTMYTDETADETGAYEYTVVPRRIWDADIGPAPAAQRGYRSLDKIEIVQARQLYPWTTQVALDVYFASGRDEATDGAVTYRLEAALADGTAIPVKTLRLEPVDGEPLDPENIPFGAPSLASGTTTRLWWDAAADTDIGAEKVVSNIVLRIVPTLAEDAPEGAVPAPSAASSAAEGFTVDTRTVRPVTVGEKIPITWEWMRTDARDETKDRTFIYGKSQSGYDYECELMQPTERTGEGAVELSEGVTDELWTSFRLIKREKNDDDTSDANVVELTSEVLFQLPAEPVTNVQATRGNPYTVTVTWDPVPYASGYQLEVLNVGEKGQTTMYTKYVFDGTWYVDTRAPEVGLVKYVVRAEYPNRVTGEPSEPVVGWRTLDKAELTNVSTRWPWKKGIVDIDLTYQTARGQYAKIMGAGDNLPGKTVTVAVTTAQGEAFAVQSLTRETLEGDVIRIRETVKNGAFTLGANDRIIWDAPTDAPKMYESGCTLKVTLSGDEYSNKMTFEKTFDLDTRTGVIELPFGAEDVQIPWSTRWAKPGATSLGLTDNWWKQTAVLTDITDDANPNEILRTEAKLGEGTTNSWTPKSWGLNTLTLTLAPASGDNERTEYAAVFKMPDFAFSVEAENADGVTLKWNALNGAASYEIRRRKVGESTFETVTNVVDATTWTDSTVETVVGDFEYMVVPKTASGGDGSLPVKPSVSGTRGAPQQVQNVVASTNDTNAVTVTWDAVPNVAYYQLDVTTYGERGNPTTQTQKVSDGTRYVDTTAPAVGLVRYTVTAVYANGMTGATSAPVVGWRMLDAVDWKGVSTRWPWNGTVDIDFVYQTGRRHYAMATGAAEDLPERIVTVAVKTAQGVDLQVQTLTLETLDEDINIIGRQKVTNGAFTLGSADRIIWDAPADAPVGMYEPGATLTVTLKGDAYSEAIVFEKTFDLDTRIGDIELPFGAEDVQIPWSTRWAKPDTAVLGSTDNWWKQTAVLADITDSANPVEILRTEAKLGEGTTNSWTPKDWRNTLTLKLSPYSGESNETTEYAAVFKFPDFDFTATTDDEDGVTLTWDDLDGAESYEIRRRKAGETDFVTVTNVTDATAWTDDSVETVVGDFEYIVVPISKTGTTLPAQAPVSGTRGAPKTVQNVTATTNDTEAVTVTWDTVPYAAYYEVAVENWDVAINRTTRPARADSNRFVDDRLPQPGLGRYTVTAVYANGMKGAASEAAVGYAVLDTMQILGVSTRWPWNGKVDLDVEYKTVRPRFRELFGMDDLPYPTNVTLAAQTAEGAAITVTTLEREPAVDKNYTVNRKAVENGTAIFSGSGWLRLVWDADADTQNNLLATNATLTLTASDDYCSLTDSCTVDIDTTRPLAIPLAEDVTEVTLPWAARWADEESESLNMQDGTDAKLVAITKYATVTNVVDTLTQLSDESGAFTNQVGYGITVFECTFSNRATTASQMYRCLFFRAPVIPVTVTRMPGMNALDIRWTGAGDCENYQIVRRTVYADGTRSAWQNMAPVSLYGEGHPEAGTGRYIDIGVVGGMTYEYAACPRYNDPDKRVEYITAEPVVWTAGSVAINVVLDALGRYLEDGSTIVTQFVGDVYGTLPTATRTGYRLVGWTLGVTNGAPEAVEGGNLLVPANHTLYAKWAVDPAVSPDVDADGNSIFDWAVGSDGQTARILGFSDPQRKVANLVLPDTLGGHPVTEIADYAFANSTSGLTALTLPAYCTRIGTRAFSGIKTLARLTFTPVRAWASPSDAGELVIGRYAFAATGLTEVFLPVEVVQIGDYAFADCRKLTDVKVLGRPAVGERPFRRAGIDAGVKPTIHLNKDLESDADYLDRITQDFGNDVFEVRTDAVVTGLSLGALAVPAPGTVFLSVDVERASAWGEVDVSRLRVAYRASLGDAPTDLVPRAVTHEADGSLTVEVDAPEGPSGFFRVKLVK